MPINKRNDECLKRVKEDEPVFTLRAQDRFASMLVRLWADLAYSQLGEVPKVTEAYQTAKQMDEWALDNTTKFPD